jgi:hypothetical protein
MYNCCLFCKYFYQIMKNAHKRFFGLLANYLVVAYHLPLMEGPAPAWVFVLSAFAIGTHPPPLSPSLPPPSAHNR